MRRPSGLTEMPRRMMSSGDFPRSCSVLGPLPSREQHFALRILHEAGDGADDAAFPRAVRADERDYPALRDAHADALHRMDAAVVDVEILDFKHGC